MHFSKEKKHEFTIFDKLNAFTENEGNNSRYYTSDQLNDLGLKKHDKKMLVMHLNISPLLYHTDDLTELLNYEFTRYFKIIDAIESRL